MLRIERLATMPQEKQQIMLQELPSRLAEDGQFDRLYMFLTSYDFLQMKMDIIGLEPLINDYTLVKDLGDKRSFTLQRIADALRAGIAVLRQVPDELWNQIKGRADVVLQTSHPRPMPRLDLRFATLLPADKALLHIFDGHSSITDCTLSADGTRALSASKDRTLHLWDTANRRLIRTLEEPQSFVKSCTLSKDGRLAFTLSQNGTLRLWNTTSGQILHTLEGPTGLSTARGTLCATGERALTGGRDGTLRVWDTASGQVLRTLNGHKSEVTACALNENGRLALSASEDKMLCLWDTESGEMLRTLSRRLRLGDAESDDLLGHRGVVYGCALSADGKVALSISSHPVLGLFGHSILQLWDTGNGRVLRVLKGHRSHLASCALSGDGRVAVSSSTNGFFGVLLGYISFLGSLLGALGYFDLERQEALRIWDATRGRTRRTLKGGVASSFAISSDGALALTVIADDPLFFLTDHQMLKLWDITGEETFSSHKGHTGVITGCALSADGRLALSASHDRTLRLWDTSSGQTLRILKGHRSAILSCALSGDGKRALSLSADGIVRFWDTSRGRTLRTYTFPKKTAGNGRCALSDDGRLALLPGSEAAVLWDTTSGQTLQEAFATAKGFNVSVSDLSSPAKFQHVMKNVGDRVSDPNWEGFWAGIDALSADGRLVLSTEFGEQGILRLWDTTSGRMLYQLKGQSKRVIDCALSRDGQIALAAFEDGKLQWWDTTSRQTLGMLEGQSKKIKTCALSRDGHLALAVSEDGILQLWNTISGQEVGQWIHDNSLWCCALSTDGRIVMAGDPEGGVHFLDIVDVLRAESESIGEPVERPIFQRE